MASRHTMKSWLARDIRNALDAQPQQPKVLRGEKLARLSPKPTGIVVQPKRFS